MEIRPGGRQSIRLRAYDYAGAGAYFVTVCTEGRRRVFGDIAGGRMMLNDAGRTVSDTWEALPTRFPGITVDAFVVMPDHVHGVVWIRDAVAVDARIADVGTADVGIVGAPLVGALRPVAPPPGGMTDAADSASRHGGGVTDDAEIGATAPGAVTAPTYGGDVGRAPTSGAPTIRPAPTALGGVVGAFKSLTTNDYARGVRAHGWPPFPGRLWQRNYYERVVRDDTALRRIRAYIERNPARWTLDREGNGR